MKKLVVLLAVFCLASIGAFAQAKTADYSGEWTLDKSKSTLGGRMQNIESMTMAVTQSEKELKVATSTKRGAPPQGAGGTGGPGGAPGAGGPPPGGGPGSGMGGGRGMGGMGMGDQTLIYSLDGKETSAEFANLNGGTSSAITRVKTTVGHLELTSVRTFNTQMGEVKATTTETWELQADGSLKIKRNTETPRGSDAVELVFTKKTK